MPAKKIVKDELKLTRGKRGFLKQQFLAELRKNKIYNSLGTFIQSYVIDAVAYHATHSVIDYTMTKESYVFEKILDIPSVGILPLKVEVKKEVLNSVL